MPPAVTADQTIDAADPAVTVVIVNFNAGPHLTAVLTGLRNQSYPAFRAIIVDNASSDGSIAAARPAVRDDARFDFIESRSNIGFAAANNLAANGTDTPWLALLNPDAVPTTDWLEQLMAATDRHPDAVMFGSTQLNMANPEILDGAGDRYFAAGIPWRGGYGWPRTALPPEGEVFSPCAAAALYRTDIFRAASGFEESFFCYIEDVDLAFRLRLRGHRCIQVPAAIVHHAGSATSGGANSAFARYHGTRNMIWCFVRNMPAPLFYPLLPFHIGTLLVLWLRACWSGMNQPVGRGIIDAVRGLAVALAQRSRIQTARKASTAQIAGWLTWNPAIYLRRSPASLR
ncbi:glycosyltransferase family 2 protein [Ferrovibrio terrae]|uniref:Glycosyltransferase family 2 protein n=1 Tax=Ferrovibrio terrae TaxID=2594003 RepID=A0A516GXR7_9PROT|nr:glycosyltransferase family 2 protein [Ferrovibrio terrae]